MTMDKVTLKSPYNISTILDIKIETKINEHAKMYIKGILEYKDKKLLDDFIPETKPTDEIQLLIRNEEEVDETAFYGIPKDISIEIINDVVYIEINAISGTHNLDIKPNSRSFQKGTMTYNELINVVKTENLLFDCIPVVGNRKAIGQPIFQYKETDWEFLKRIATFERSFLVADMTSSESKLFFGMPISDKVVTITDEIVTREEIKEDLYNISSYNYRVQLFTYLKIGDKIKVGYERPFEITETKIELEKGLITYKYKFQNMNYLKPKVYCNEKIKGVSFPATVLDVRANYIKAHLDIDPVQKIEDARWYPYVSLNQNTWFTMPHIGERVGLHIIDTEETAVVQSVTRGTTGKVAKAKNMSKPTEKIMSTKWHKNFALHEGDVEISIPTVTVKLDEENITVTSNDKINIDATHDINIGKTTIVTKDGVIVQETKNINIEAEDLLTFWVTNKMNAIELDSYTTVSALINTHMEGKNKSALPVISYEGDDKQVQEVPPPPEPEPQPIVEPEEKKPPLWKRIGKGALKVVGGIAVGVCAVATCVAIVATAPVSIPSIIGCSFVVGGTGAVVLWSAGKTDEGISDIKLGASGISENEQRASNIVRDSLFNGDEDAYNKLLTYGTMSLIGGSVIVMNAPLLSQIGGNAVSSAKGFFGAKVAQGTATTTAVQQTMANTDLDEKAIDLTDDFVSKTTGAFNSDTADDIGNGLGKLTDKAINVTEKGLNIIKEHLAQFEQDNANDYMIRSIEEALAKGEKLTNGNASFYMHELAESTLMKNGYDYYTAHEMALQKYLVSPFSVYSKEAVNAFPAEFGSKFVEFWMNFK